jgi:hypothetical protein
MCSSQIVFCDQYGETIFQCQLDIDHIGLHCYTANNGLFEDSQPYLILWKGDSKQAQHEIESYITLMSQSKQNQWSH